MHHQGSCFGGGGGGGGGGTQPSAAHYSSDSGEEEEEASAAGHGAEPIDVDAESDGDDAMHATVEGASAAADAADEAAARLAAQWRSDTAAEPTGASWRMQATQWIVGAALRPWQERSGSSSGSP